MLLKDKVAVIYGAGGGIGGAVARAFASEGAQVFLTGRVRTPVQAVAKDIQDLLGRHDGTLGAVVGKTAGSVAAPVYGGLVADLLPDVRVTVFAGQSGAFPDDPEFNAKFFGELWGAYDTMRDWEVNEGLTARDWGPRRFWIQAGRHNPGITMARFDFAFDKNAARQLESRGVDSSTMVELIDANEAAIEAAGVNQHGYTAPGDEHGIFEFERFYELEV